eukprot:12373019-Ditylum_brightwellii.AAC.1
MTIPSFSNLAAQFGCRAIQYFAAILTKAGGASFLSRAIAPEGTARLTQYEYDQETHKVKLTDMDIPDDDADVGLEGFEDIQNPFSSVTVTSEPTEVIEIGSLASAQVKGKSKSALSPSPKYQIKTGIVTPSYILIKTEKTPPVSGKEATEPIISHSILKTEVRHFRSRIGKSKFTISDIIADVEDASIATTITSLFGGKESIRLFDYYIILRT